MNAITRYHWEQRYEEVKHNPTRLQNLMNDFYACYPVEINVYPWHKNFHEKVVNRLETVAQEIVV